MQGSIALHRVAKSIIDRLFNEAEEAADEDDSGCDGYDDVDLADTGLPAVGSTSGKKRCRKPLPQELPRARVEYELADDQKACPYCHGQMHCMSEAVTGQLRIGVKAKVLQNVWLKYACRHCDRPGINTPVVVAPKPSQPLPDSIARRLQRWPSRLFTKTLIAHTTLPRGSHLPARRRSSQLRRSCSLG